MSESKKRRGGPKHEPDARSRRLVEVMVLMKASAPMIARALKITDDTLRKYYKNEIGGLKRGAPAYEPSDQDRRTVETLVGYGATRSEVAAALGINEDTMEKYYREELTHGGFRFRMKIMESLHRQAIGGPAMIDPNSGAVLKAEQVPVPSVSIFLGKTRCGLRERDPIPPPPNERDGNFDLSRLNDEQLALYEQLVAQATDPAYQTSAQLGGNPSGTGKTAH